VHLLFQGFEASLQLVMKILLGYQIGKSDMKTRFNLRDS